MFRSVLFGTGLALMAMVPAHAEAVTEFTLENGLDVVVIEDHRSPAVVHMLWYKVGAADEMPGKSGIAHLLEHLMFKGTEIRSPGEFSQIVEANGGNDNAFTSWDYTGYFQRIAADRLPLMMEMEADRMTNLQLTDELTAPEVSVVLEERNQRTDSNPDALFREQASAAQYLNHPYGRPVIGWRHEVEALTAEDALAFYRRFYVPNNAILIVAGDVTPDEVRSLAETYYGGLVPNPDLAERDRVIEPPQIAARRLVFEDPRIAQPYVVRSYLAPERNSGDQEQAAALSLLGNLLGDGPATSVLGRKLQFDTEVALYTAAYYAGTSLDATTFNLTVVPVDGVSLADAEAALDDVLRQFMIEGVDEDHLARLKRQYAADAIYSMDDAQGLARRYGDALTSGLTVADVQAWPEVIQAVTPEQIMAAAEMVFQDRNSVTGWLRAPIAAETEVTQ
ncbi:pitrilysin family protein [Pseudoruegeria sp. SK021]|uniref:M16 family metallopeptidase n=1 Tax=Pseudoruegeria sp. SK021 TaxID=1933035 RepID=UPI000A220407|nr:pitrilysin family protein [Pseudoruegeria sp. SK021]OSP55030.1 peptidase M16 [Pseudoruegeria sp. SK021]